MLTIKSSIENVFFFGVFFKSIYKIRKKIRKYFVKTTIRQKILVIPKICKELLFENAILFLIILSWNFLNLIKYAFFQNKNINKLIILILDNVSYFYFLLFFYLNKIILILFFVFLFECYWNNWIKLTLKKEYNIFKNKIKYIRKLKIESNEIIYSNLQNELEKFEYKKLKTKLDRIEYITLKNILDKYQYNEYESGLVEVYNIRLLDRLINAFIMIIPISIIFSDNTDIISLYLPHLFEFINYYLGDSTKIISKLKYARMPLFIIFYVRLMRRSGPDSTNFSRIYNKSAYLDKTDATKLPKCELPVGIKIKDNIPRFYLSKFCSWQKYFVRWNASYTCVIFFLYNSYLKFRTMCLKKKFAFLTDRYTNNMAPIIDPFIIIIILLFYFYGLLNSLLGYCTNTGLDFAMSYHTHEYKDMKINSTKKPKMLFIKFLIVFIILFIFGFQKNVVYFFNNILYPFVF